MFSIKTILKMMKPFLGDVEKQLATAMEQQDKELGTENIAYLIRRVKNHKGETVCQMAYVDIKGYTAIEEDPKQEYAMKALFVKDKNKTEDFPNGKNSFHGIDGIFTSVTSEKEEDDDQG